MKAAVVLAALICVAQCALRSEEEAAVKAMGDPCDTVFCSLGQECVIKDKLPVCACIERCERAGESVVPVCGSVNGTIRTYPSECHLYKESCETGDSKITLVAHEACEKKIEEEKKVSKDLKKNAQKEKPVICMEKDRDGLRDAIIKFVTGKMGISSDAASYKGTLMKYFFHLDIDADKKIDTKEFMAILEEDVSITDILNHDNPVLRGLCSSALIAITDYNSDYKLEFEEFFKCLDPKFSPPKEKCELGGMVYEDGEDVPLECDNSCACACGNWVCTQKKCDHKHAESNSAEDFMNQ